MAMSFRELHNNDTGYNCSEINLAIEVEKNREKSIKEKIDNAEEYLVWLNGDNANKFKIPQKNWTDSEWQEYYNYLIHKCKLDKLKYSLKLKNAICPECGNKNKYCICVCENCKKVGMKCDCLPF